MIFQDQQVAPRYPGYDPKADPALGDGNWRPWRKSEDELQDLSVEERDAYMNETHGLKFGPTPTLLSGILAMWFR